MSVTRPAEALRLAKLPERAPIKLTIALDPASHALLQEYAELYSLTYGASEPLAELIPYIVNTFIDNDKAFARTKRKRKQG